MPEPASFVSVVKEAQAVLSLLRHPLRWVGHRLGTTSAPNIVVGSMMASALPDDPPTDTYRQGYFTITLRVNERAKTGGRAG